MKKIISLFQRNYETDRLVRNEVVPGAEWVLAGEGIPTRKWDGTACMVRDHRLYKRYDVKCQPTVVSPDGRSLPKVKGQQPPAGWKPCQDPDPITGHWPGWLAVGNGPEDRWYHDVDGVLACLFDGTYELIGPKVQGNPEAVASHTLVRHGEYHLLGVPRDFEGIRDWLSQNTVEGIVWWRDLSDVDCDKVKIKRKDMGLSWPVRAV